MSIKRVSNESRRDYEFFLNTPLDTIGVYVGGDDKCVRDSKAREWQISLEGNTALECWFAFDTYGKILDCREPAQLGKALRSKASWNLQIEHWAEDIADGLILQQSELVDYCHGLPEWIFQAVMAQAAKRSRKSLGWAPRFARLEYLKGQWWPTYMDSFDPMI